MKKFCARMLVILILLGLCACGQEAKPGEPSASAATEATTEETTTAPATKPIKYPASYKDAPAAYKPMLDACYYQAQGGNEENIAEVYVMEPWFFEMDELGYAIKDINKDGVPELLLLTWGHRLYAAEGEPFVLSLFTLADNKPIHLASYWRRERARFAADGTIYLLAGHGGSYSGLRSYRLEAGAGELTQLSEYYYDDIDFFKGSYAEMQPMEEEEYSALEKQYLNPKNTMQFKFNQLENSTTVEPKTKAPETIFIEYPTSYKDVPAAYKPMLDELYRFVCWAGNGVEIRGFYNEVGAGIAEAAGAAVENGKFRHGYIGYAIKDINRDGVPELDDSDERFGCSIVVYAQGWQADSS